MRIRNMDIYISVLYYIPFSDDDVNDFSDCMPYRNRYIYIFLGVTVCFVRTMFLLRNLKLILINFNPQQKKINK